jgi:putative Holliday junction resolvase
MAGILGLDLGEKRTGIAFAESEVPVAAPLETFEGQAGKAFVVRLRSLVEEYRIKTIVVGLPLNLEGAEGIAAQKIRSKVDWLQSEITGLEWLFWDERLTSVEAEWMLQEQGVRRDKRKGLRDQLAAKQILQSYLDSKKMSDK